MCVYVCVLLFGVIVIVVLVAPVVDIKNTLYAYENCKPSGIPNAQKQIVNNQGS